MNFVVIGASRGLGFALTQALMGAGHKVVAGSRRPAPDLSELKLRYPEALLLLEADVTDETLMQKAASSACEFLGQIDAICISAGVLLDGDRVNLLHEADITELRFTFDVNTIGPVIVTKSFMPYLTKGARVCIVTSEGVGVKNCGTWVPAYGLSKTAATKTAGIFNASVEGIDFYAVHPGRMNTDMGRTTAQIEALEAANGFVRLMDKTTPISREQWYIDYEGKPMDA